MTVEVEYRTPWPVGPASDWQVQMAKQIEENRGYPLESIEREVSGSTVIVSVETTLPDSAVQNMLSDIEDYLPSGSTHVETREI